MSEQSLVIKEMQELIMGIIKSGTTTIEDANKMDKLETQLYKQRCFKKTKDTNCENQGEEIANFFFNDTFTQGIDKMYEYKITPLDFFGFVEYHYSDDHDDEDLVEMFTGAFVTRVNEAYAKLLIPKK